MYSILPKNERNSLILSREDAQDNEFCSFFGRIEETINCFLDLLTFNGRDFEGLTHKNYELFMIIFSKLSKALTYIDRSDTGKIIEFIA